jgi:hypothetical protein
LSVVPADASGDWFTDFTERWDGLTPNSSRWSRISRFVMSAKSVVERGRTTGAIVEPERNRP